MQVYCLATELINLLQDILDREKAVYIRATGESMLPTIRDQEVVKIVPLHDEIKRHEILLYRDSRGKPIMHRVVHIVQDNPVARFQVRADNSWYGGEIIERHAILGKAACVIRDEKEVAIEKIKGRQLFIYGRILEQLMSNIFERLGFKQ